MNHVSLQTSSRGYSLISLLIGVWMAAVVGFGVFSLISYTQKTARVFTLTSDLERLREDAIKRIDCQKSLAAIPCEAKDRFGNDWPNASHQVGDFQTSSSCSASGLIISRKYTKTDLDKSGTVSMTIAKEGNFSDWLPLFEDRTAYCEGESMSSPVATPYYQLVSVTSTSTFGCDTGNDYQDGAPANSHLGYAYDGTAYCPAGYTVAGGGIECAATTSAPAAQTLRSQRTYNGATGLWGWYGWCCAFASTSPTPKVRAVCIRN